MVVMEEGVAACPCVWIILSKKAFSAQSNGISLGVSRSLRRFLNAWF
jgi:hypothetical protein